MSTKVDADEPAQITEDLVDPNHEIIKRQILQFKGHFPMDFTEDFLDTLPISRLIHILQAARIQQRKNKD